MQSCGISEYSSKNRAIKIMTIIVFTLIISALSIAIKTLPATGYEISIYNAYPTLFWIFILSSIILSICIIIISSISDSKYYIYGILALFICYTVILLLPSIRGYLFYAKGNFDMFAHLADIRIVLESGHIGRDLIYPITHILAAELNLITSLSLRDITKLFTIFFTLFYISSFYLLGKAITKNNRAGLFMLVFASPLLYSFLHHTFYPFFFAFCLIPFILYCIHKKIFQPSWKFSLITLILSFSIVFFHPFILIMLLITFIVFGIFFGFKKKKDYKQRYSTVINSILVLIVSFFAWYFTFSSFLRFFKRVINALFNSVEITIYEYQMNAIESSGVNILLVVERFIKIYGSLSLYVLLAIFCLIILFTKKYATNDTEKIYGLLFISAILFGLFQAMAYFVIFEPMRILSFAILTASILLGLVFYILFENTPNANKRRIIAIYIMVIICLPSVLSVLNVYESPWKGTPNMQMTQMDANGFDWFLENANYSIPVMNQFNPIRNYVRYSSTFDNNNDPTGIITEINLIPTHFDYETNETMSKTIGDSNRYMITSEFIRKLYLAVPKNRRLVIPQYPETDFEKLNRDPTVDKIYLNGEFELWSITSRL